MTIFVTLILPVVIIIGVLFLCKMFNFSMLPKGWQLPPPKKFKFPLLKRRPFGTWYAVDGDYLEPENSDDEDD